MTIHLVHCLSLPRVLNLQLNVSLFSVNNTSCVRQNSWLFTHNPALPAHIPAVRPNLSHSRRILYVIDLGIPALRFQPNPFYPACHTALEQQRQGFH
jgi:hypothetical protein